MTMTISIAAAPTLFVTAVAREMGMVLAMVLAVLKTKTNTTPTALTQMVMV